MWTDLDNEMYDAGMLFLAKHLKECQVSIFPIQAHLA
jgi:hypothetical protein